MASATDLLGPWLDSSMLWRGSPFSSSVFRRGICGRAAWWSSSSSTCSGGRLSHQVPFCGGVIHETGLHQTPRLGMGRAQVTAILVQAMPGTGSHKSKSTATSRRRVHRSICPGAVAMTARQIVAVSEEGGHSCCQFHHLSRLQKLQ
jgi:hypothetical protein